MTDSNATYNTSITVDLPDYAGSTVKFTNNSGVFVSGNSEIFPKETYTLTLDTNGQGTQILPCPDNTGTLAVNWVILLPSGEGKLRAIAYSASAQALSDILASESATTAPNDITAALANKVALATFDAHVADTTAVHGITDTSALETTTGAQAKADAAEAAAIAADDYTEYIIVALSDETSDLEAGTAKATFTMPYAMMLTAVLATVATAPTGSAIQVGINEGGVSILSTDLTIDAGETSSATAAVPAVISDSALAAGAVITMDLDAVGSSVAGSGLKVTLTGTRIP